MLVRCKRLLKPLTFSCLLHIPPLETARDFQHSVYGRGTHRDHVLIHHQVRQTTIPFARMLSVEDDNRQLFPSFQPMIAGHQAIVFVCLAVTLFPSVKFTQADADPLHQSLGRQFGASFPVLDVINDFVPGIMGNPGSFQSSPLAFFALTFSSINSEITSFLLISLA